MPAGKKVDSRQSIGGRVAVAVTDQSDSQVIGLDGGAIWLVAQLGGAGTASATTTKFDAAVTGLQAALLS